MRTAAFKLPYEPAAAQVSPDRALWRLGTASSALPRAAAADRTGLGLPTSRESPACPYAECD
jgi:hypothetical protein